MNVLSASLLLFLCTISYAAPPPGKIDWSRCFEEEGDDFECALVSVPIDHNNPNGPAIQLSLLRIPAKGEKLGSIFLNPGGPGGSGVRFARNFGPHVGDVWGPAVAEHYDIIGFDPRGIGQSTALNCFENNTELLNKLSPAISFPTTVVEKDVQMLTDAYLASECRKHGGWIGSHISASNVARDIDFIRESLGEDQINFVGLSYGSYVGSVYANLFPDRVRAMVIDGVLDPVAWQNEEGKVPVTTRIQSGKGAQDTLERFFTLCEEAHAGNCALADDAQLSPKERFDNLASRLRNQTDPRQIFSSGEVFLSGEALKISYQFLIELTLGALYSPLNFPALANFVVALEEEEASESQLSQAFADLQGVAGFSTSKKGTIRYQNFAEGFPGVACTDSKNPSSYDMWTESAEKADNQGYFGRLWTWDSSACLKWPFEDKHRYTGGFEAETAGPIMIVGNLQDPATPYDGALVAASLLPNSFIVTVDMAGHTSLGLSTCASNIIGQYLLDPEGTAANVGTTTCDQEFNAFDLVSPSGNIFSARKEVSEEVSFRDDHAFRAQLMKDVAFQPIHM